MIDVRRFSLVSDQVEYTELEVIIRELQKIIDAQIQGAVIEMGCYTGTTSLFVQRLLRSESDVRPFHVYDSFEGLPSKTSQDASPAGEQFRAGELHASKQQFIKHFKQAGLPLPYIHKNWFEALRDTDMPKAIAFAFLDGDFYSSISSSLQLITPRLARGAIVVIDDYQSESLPGVRKAVDEWAAHHKLTLKVEQSLAIIQWP